METRSNSTLYSQHTYGTISKTMTKNAPDNTDELEATAENPPTPESHPRDSAPDDPTRLKRRDHYESELGDNGNKPRTDGGPRDANPGNDANTSPLSTLLNTPVEIHALVIGAAIGVMAARTGDFNAIAAIVGAGALGSRAQLGLSEKYLAQAKAELPYAIAGIAIGYVIVRFGPQLAALGA